jgi:hypothetical protein
LGVVFVCAPLPFEARLKSVAGVDELLSGDLVSCVHACGKLVRLGFRFAEPIDPGRFLDLSNARILNDPGEAVSERATDEATGDSGEGIDAAKPLGDDERTDMAEGGGQAKPGENELSGEDPGGRAVA